MRVGLFIVLVSVGLSACDAVQTEFNSQDELLAYVNEPSHGYVQSVESKDFLVEGKLLPPISSDKTGSYTIQVRISRLDGRPVLESGNAGQPEVLQREGYLSFDLMQDAYMECDGHEFNPVFHHYERNYGIKPSIDIRFDFPKMDPQSDPVFHYRDKLFGQGLIRLKFDKELFATCYVKES